MFVCLDDLSHLPISQLNKPKLTYHNCATVHTNCRGNLVLMVLYVFIPLLKFLSIQSGYRLSYDSDVYRIFWTSEIFNSYIKARITKLFRHRFSKTDETGRYDFWSRFLLHHSPFLFPLFLGVIPSCFISKTLLVVKSRV